MNIGYKIKLLREKMGLSQDELAQKIGYKSKTSIHKIEQGNTDLPLSKVNEFAQALETSSAYLMGWEDEPVNMDSLTPETSEIKSILNRDGKTSDIIDEIGNNFTDEDKEKTLEFIKFLKSQKNKKDN